MLGVIYKQELENCMQKQVICTSTETGINTEQTVHQILHYAVYVYVYVYVIYAYTKS